MNVSSILVLTSNPHFETTVNALTTIDGLQVHYCDAESSRIVVTQEAEDTSNEMKGLQRIKSLPHVIMAEMVYHYCDQDSE